MKVVFSPKPTSTGPSPYTTGSVNFWGEGLVLAKLGRSSSFLKYSSMCGYCSFLFEVYCQQRCSSGEERLLQ